MKISLVALLSSLIFFSCSGTGENQKLIGQWKLTEFIESGGEKVELKDCDQKTVWNFNQTKKEPLSDGTEVYELKAEAPDDCKFFGFDAKWTIKDGQLFVSTSRIGGIGGSSIAGMMNIEELSETKLKVNHMKRKLIFEKM